MPIPTTFTALVKVALSCGYILTRHEDCHLIAIPWTETAAPAEDLIETMFGEGDHHAIGEPTKKLHGRKSWHIGLGRISRDEELSVDVSVMPRIATEKQRLSKRHTLATRNQGIYNDFVYNEFTLGALAHKYDLSTFHLSGILEQLRQRRQRSDSHAGIIRPGADPYKRRVKSSHGHEPGYILVYPPKDSRYRQGPEKDKPPVWNYREAQKEADRLNKETA